MTTQNSNNEPIGYISPSSMRIIRNDGAWDSFQIYHPDSKEIGDAPVFSISPDSYATITNLEKEIKTLNSQLIAAKTIIASQDKHLAQLGKQVNQLSMLDSERAANEHLTNRVEQLEESLLDLATKLRKISVE